MTLEGEYYFPFFEWRAATVKVAILMTLEGEYYGDCSLDDENTVVSQSS